MAVNVQRLVAERARSLTEDTAWVWDYLPATLPPPWSIVQRTDDGYAAEERRRGVRVIASGAMEQDGRRWLHVSLSRKDRVPAYGDMSLVKEVFLGPDRVAYQVFAPRSRHVNLHPYCLHLWCPVDGPVLPDFTRGTGSI